jgi:hypothetical protein
MDQDRNTDSSEEAEIEREILQQRKFTLEEAIGRLAGPGAMKGESPIARMRQAEIEIETWLSDHLPEAKSELATVLSRQVKASELLLNNFDQPLIVLAGYCRQVLDSPYRLSELVREVDVEWGRLMDERPHFEIEGRPPHPDDPYTIATVQSDLNEVLNQLAASASI